MSTPWRPTRQYTGNKGTCMYGVTCVKFRKNKCTYFHADQDRVKLADSIHRQAALLAQSQERLSKMLEGLDAHPDILAAAKTKDTEDDAADTSTDQTCPVRITAERVLASFNKVSDDTIAVPGCPPRFSPPTTHAIRVSHDDDGDGDYGSDRDKRRLYPTYTHGLEPLVRAVQCMSPDVDVLNGACDIVANAGSIYRLFNFLVRKSFATLRCDLEWRPPSPTGMANGDGDGAGGTLLIQQWKDDPDHDVSYGFGTNFAAATCRFGPDLPEALQTSFSHHRVLYYELGGLRFAVHCEADGHYDPHRQGHAATVQFPLSPPVSPKLAMSTPTTTPASPRSKAKGSRFSVLMEDADDEETKQAFSSPTLTVDYPCGPAVPVPADHLVEVKTFNAQKRDAWLSTSAKSARYVRYGPDSQLYFGRTAQLYEAGHKRGVFEPNVHVENVAGRLQLWEEDNQQDLARLVVFLRDLLQRAAAHAADGRMHLSLVLPGAQDPSCKDKRATLHVRSDSASFLPETL
ncbi:uncharacterized protein SPSK_03302 [Sporothrix schenckii 1099-18]|uniref:Uncharacterized protein n=1 Tax=Sporothrix schenckii 1099-18 TaxID=1397361 RepID=A0A0F2LX17_SPOSC|nr:uncharacterized protein SPSK_03302 [Sporothrix schenckii 1099-18]KJR81997.1 hypothetical protein SPSK_03302 [Sporothrix schenckii 1099-18]